MKHLKILSLSILALIMLAGCSLPSQFGSPVSLEERGWDCDNATVVLHNKTKSDVTVTINNETHTIAKGKKFKKLVNTGSYDICVAGICEKGFKLYPCMRYDFTPSLL